MVDRDQGARLRSAVKENHSIASIKRILHASPESITSADPQTRMTPLLLAANEGHQEIFELLLLCGAEETTISKVCL